MERFFYKIIKNNYLWCSVAKHINKFIFLFKPFDGLIIIL